MRCDMMNNRVYCGCIRDGCCRIHKEATYMQDTERFIQINTQSSVMSESLPA